MSSPAFHVLWSENATLDLEETVGYLARESPSRAGEFLTRVRQAATTLGALPKRGRLVPELVEFGITTWRELVIRPHRLVYRIDRRTVFVDGLFDSRRDLEELLVERLLAH